MTEKKKSIRRRLLLIVLFPIILLSIVITVVGMMLFYSFYTQSIRDELVSTTNMMFDCLDLAVEGDYTYQDGMLLKGDLNITDSKMLHRIKDESEIDTTIFWEDTRILTTVEDAAGISAVGTKADKEVADSVLSEGRSVFPDELSIGGIPYIGYYTPIENSDHEIVGMMFAGKQKSLVYDRILQVVLCFSAFSAITIIIAILIIKSYSSGIILAINRINDYLKKISEGDLRAALDDSIANRNDELGSIGLYASVMRRKLQKLVEMDPLTDLYNRRSCHNLMEAIVKKKETYSVVMCDIDFFKKINDNYGHDAGDYVLVELSRLLRESVWETGYASRWGGEEFLLVYKLDFAKAKAKAEQLQKNVREYDFSYQGIRLKVTMTFGVAEGKENISYEEVIKEADEKLYIGKNNGRDQIVA